MCDCIDWYGDDEAIINNMTEDELEHMVLHYLKLRDAYRNRHIDSSASAAQGSAVDAE
jgi:hypothetical protein